MRSLVWYRGKDLRISDHAPLHDAAGRGELICAFVLDPYFFAAERARALPHRMQFLLESIASLAENLERLGSRLILVEGKSVDLVPEMARRWAVDRVVGHRWSEPFGRERDRRVQAALTVPFELWEGETLAAPGVVRTAAGDPFSVFTPYARAHRAAVQPALPLPAPRKLPPVPRGIESGVTLPTLAQLGIARNPRLVAGGERAARGRLREFLAGPASQYHEVRDRLDLAATSRLSADLKFGTLSVRTVWTAARSALAEAHPDAWQRFSDELLWRDFTHDVLREHPTLLERPRRAQFERFPWVDDPAGWRAWVEGKTGYPIVDAAARQLSAEGFVHNRARMIAASFLTKHLLIDYRRGEAHYLAYLTDGDWAQNNFGWQWSAGCGFDAQPYFRIFNPVTQGERFDPEGAYVRRWLPELAGVPDRFVHHPWDAPSPPAAYPPPIVEHRAARERFLALAAQHLG